MPSFFLIHPTVWPQYTNVTDRTGRTDRQDRQLSDSTGRTVLQTVTQKQLNRSRCRLGCELGWIQGIACYVVQIPHGKGKFWGKGAPVVKEAVVTCAKINS